MVFSLISVVNGSKAQTMLERSSSPSTYWYAGGHPACQSNLVFIFIRPTTQVECLSEFHLHLNVLTYQVVRLCDLEMAVAVRSWNKLYYTQPPLEGNMLTIDYNPRSIFSFLCPTSKLNTTSMFYLYNIKQWLKINSAPGPQAPETHSSTFMLPKCNNRHYCNGFRLRGSPGNWTSLLFGVNPEEQKQIENITRIRFTYLRHHAV
jgi:hypothetical protein